MNHSKPYRRKSRYVSWKHCSPPGNRRCCNCIRSQLSGKKTESYGNSTNEQLIDEGFRDVGN